MWGRKKKFDSELEDTIARLKHLEQKIDYYSKVQQSTASLHLERFKELNRKVDKLGHVLGYKITSQPAETSWVKRKKTHHDG